jgi:hypothetical protein
MKKTLCCAVAGAWLTGISFSRSVPPPQSPETAPASVAPQPAGIEMHFTPGTLIRAELEKPIDANKAKVGDQVLARTTDDLNSTPPGLATQGCKILGQVVEVMPHQEDSASTLKVAFDKMILKNGSDMALPANIKAVGFADQFDPATNSEQINQGGGGGIRFGHREELSVPATVNRASMADNGCPPVGEAIPTPNCPSMPGEQLTCPASS